MTNLRQRMSSRHEPNLARMCSMKVSPQNGRQTRVFERAALHRNSRVGQVENKIIKGFLCILWYPQNLLCLVRWRLTEVAPQV